MKTQKTTSKQKKNYDGEFCGEAREMLAKQDVLRRLRGDLGESFTEVLVALLVAALGTVMLVTMISAAMRITLQSGEVEDGRTQSINDIEAVLAGDTTSIGDSRLTSSSGTVTIRSDSSSSIKIGSSETSSVTVYTISDDDLSGYEELTVYK